MFGAPVCAVGSVRARNWRFASSMRVSIRFGDKGRSIGLSWTAGSVGDGATIGGDTFDGGDCGVAVGNVGAGVGDGWVIVAGGDVVEGAVGVDRVAPGVGVGEGCGGVITVRGRVSIGDGVAVGVPSCALAAIGMKTDIAINDIAHHPKVKRGQLLFIITFLASQARKSVTRCRGTAIRRIRKRSGCRRRPLRAKSNLAKRVAAQGTFERCVKKRESACGG